MKRSRSYPDVKIVGGSNWCSITHNFAEYIIEQRPQIEKYFKYSCCGDELFIQTMLVNSEYYKNWYGFKNNPESANMRIIDWKRGSPYIYDINDYNMLINSDALFCRKVSDKNPEQKLLIDKLDEYLAG